MLYFLPTFAFQGKTYVVDERLEQFRYLQPGEMPEYIDFGSDKGEEMMEAWLEHEAAEGRERNKGVKQGDQLVVVRHLWIFTHPERGDEPEYPQGKPVWVLARGDEVDPDDQESVVVVDSPEELEHPPQMPFALPWMYFAPLAWWEQHRSPSEDLESPEGGDQ